MPRRQKYVPKHRSAAPDPAFTRGVRKSVTYSGVALAATGIAVTSGVMVKDQAPADSATATIAAAQAERATEPIPKDLVADRAREASRADRRASLETNATSEKRAAGTVNHTEDMAVQDPREIARQLLPEFGFSASEFGCLDALYTSESDWDPHADNPTSSAYGIPQALTGGTHDDLPSDYMTNPVSQIRWGLGYIAESYGTPCAAWEFKQANNWY